MGLGGILKGVAKGAMGGGAIGGAIGGAVAGKKKPASNASVSGGRGGFAGKAMKSRRPMGGRGYSSR